MAANRNGKFFDRPREPESIGKTPFTILHHMIPYSVVRDFWNTLVDVCEVERAERRLPGRNRMFQAMRRYRNLLRCDLPIDGLDGVLASPLALSDETTQILAWPAFNLFQGPNSGSRPKHSPDPGGAFDFPPVGKRHWHRVKALEQASGKMIEFIHTKSSQSINQSLDLMQTWSTEPAIWAWDGNWFDLDYKHFDLMSTRERQQFFGACFNEAMWAAKGNQVHARLFGK